MAAEGGSADLIHAVALLGAGVVAVPIFKRIGLGSVIGYLAAGIAIGPFGLKIFQDPDAILHVAEFGVVMLLFVIGLELKPSRLWGLRRDIFGLGLAQVILCGALLTVAAITVGLDPRAAFVAAMGLALSSTAIVMQLLEERGETTSPYGQKIFAVLLLQDLAIVPLLAVVAIIAPSAAEASGTPRVLQVAIALAAVAGVVTVGRYLLNPMFRVFAATKAREIMTAAALLVVLGAALAMQAGGLSMAMGAFLAGVLLSESSFRHELEADIEPFRGLLLGLFFLGVGMSMDLGLIARDWALILGAVVGFMALKGAGIYAIARVRSNHAEALRLAFLLAQGGEFAFVVYATAAGVGILSSETNGLLNAAVILSMTLTPLAPIALKRLLPPSAPSLDGVVPADGLSGTALVIGFGRFGQVASQALLAQGVDVTTIDASPDRIRNATRFGFKVYYGDGTRLDVLRAAGAASAKVIAVCVDKKDIANRIVELVISEFPLAKLHVRSYDRGHTLDLLAAGVAFEIRETFESALALGEALLRSLGAPADEAASVTDQLRRRDLERLQLQQAEGITAGRHLVFGASPTPTPLTPPKRESKALSAQTAILAEGKDVPAGPASEQPP
jgi:glutathione-regulated potassium-efflux system protein KefB